MQSESKVNPIDFGDLRRMAPISRKAEFDRGTPVDRYYVDWFLGSRADDIRGRVLEIGDGTYTRLGGGRVTQSDVVALSVDSPSSVVDHLDALARDCSSAFDCVILPQTLHTIFDVPAAIRATYRVLKPEGVVLATCPGISRLSSDPDTDPQCWNFTSRSARRQFGEVFPADRVSVVVRGNVLAAVALMHGLAVEELTAAELTHVDPDYELMIGVRASRPGSDTSI